MKFMNPIPFVRDIKRSKAFYEQTIGLKVLEDFGSFVLFETGFAIHEGQALAFGRAAAQSYAAIAAHRRAIDRPFSQFDAQIAAIAARNVADFAETG